MGIYNSSKRRGNAAIYRLRASFRRRFVIIYFIVIFIYPFALWGYSINSKSNVEAILVYSFMFAAIVWLSWYTYQIVFAFRLEIDSSGGILYAFGKAISFEWHNAMQIDYTYSEGDIKYQLMLYIVPTIVKQGISLPYKFPIQFSAWNIPLDTVQKYAPFVRGIYRDLPEDNDLSIHLRYFLRTSLGQDLIQYAPHLFGNVLSKYLPDNDLKIT